MNMRLLIVTLLLGIFGVSCNNKVDLIEEGHNIPVVYGFIDLADTAQYLRIMRVFGEEDSAALKLAQEPDRVYYSDAEVHLTVEGQGTPQLLKRVDGNLEGYVRDSGSLLQSPNYLYKIKTAELHLNGTEQLTLTIDRGGKTIGNSTIRVLSPITVRNPKQGDDLTWHPRAPLVVKWKSTPYAKIYDVRMDIHISEHRLSTGKWTTKTLKWLPVHGLAKRSGSRLYEKATLSANELYSFLSTHLDADPDVERFWQSADIIIYAGGQEFIDFRQVVLANIGLTGALELPLYTNIDNGLGIFSSKYHVISGDHTLSKASIDSISLNTSTRRLNFKD